MAWRYITSNADGSMAVVTVVGPDSDGRNLVNMLFELSRVSDFDSHFNSATHTLISLANGIPGHRPIELLGECDHKDLPSSRKFRDAWEWIS